MTEQEHTDRTHAFNDRIRRLRLELKDVGPRGGILLNADAIRAELAAVRDARAHHVRNFYDLVVG